MCFRIFKGEKKITTLTVKKKKWWSSSRSVRDRSALSRRLLVLDDHDSIHSCRILTRWVNLRECSASSSILRSDLVRWHTPWRARLFWDLRQLRSRSNDIFDTSTRCMTQVTKKILTGHNLWRWQEGSRLTGLQDDADDDDETNHRFTTESDLLDDQCRLPSWADISSSTDAFDILRHTLQRCRPGPTTGDTPRIVTCDFPWQVSISTVKVTSAKDLDTNLLVVDWTDDDRRRSGQGPQLLDRCVRFHLISLTLNPDVSRCTWKAWTNLSAPFTNVNGKGFRWTDALRSLHSDDCMS